MNDESCEDRKWEIAWPMPDPHPEPSLEVLAVLNRSHARGIARARKYAEAAL